MDVTDLTIIGGGPTGLAAAFRAGMHEMSTRIVEVAGHLGGQVTALYPHKNIYDVFGIPEILGKDLVRNLVKQGLWFKPEVHLGEAVRALRHVDGSTIEVLTDRAMYITRAVVIAGGIGLISPRKLDAEGCDRLEGNGVCYAVQDPEAFRDRRVVIVGGGDSALDWTLQLANVARRITLVHRSDEFAAHTSTVREVQRLADYGHIGLHTSSVILAAYGNSHLETVRIKNSRGMEQLVEADSLLAMIGFHTSLEPMSGWGLEFQQKKIVVNSRMETNLPGVFAAGDMVSYPGKIKLIATGFAEAAIAVKSAAEYVRPGEKTKLAYSSISGLPKTKSEVVT